MSARPSSDTQTRLYEVAIVGNDTLLAALPGRAVQLAHAILAAGYDLVVPVSWGEELIAEHALRVLEQPVPHPQILCCCPQVRRRLLASGNEIVPHLLSTIAPPAAAARYLRALQPDAPVRITFVGACEGAKDAAIDVQVEPQSFLRHLEQRGISVVRQPSVFEATIPPDRRRHWSMPGGAPCPEAIQERAQVRFLVVDGRDLVTELAEHILAGDRMLLDIAPAVGCACAGAVEVHQVQGSRDAVVALEPPRSPLPVIEAEFGLVLEHPLPVLTGSNGGVPTHADVGSAEPGVTSILHAARARAERRRIAVTPAGIGSVGPPAAAPGRDDQSRSPDRPMLHTEPRGPERHSGSFDVHTPGPAAPPKPRVEPPPDTPTLMSPATDVPQPAGPPMTQEAATASPTEPGRPRRRTPTYEMHHVARAAAHTRLASGEAPGVPRAYSAVRPRPRVVEPGTTLAAAPAEHRPDEPAATPAPGPVTAATERVVGLIEPPTAGEVRRLEMAAPIAVVMEPPSTAHAGARLGGPTDLHQAAQRALRAQARPLPPPEPANPRQLWGLLASVLLIAAIAVLLFVIFS